MNYFIISQGHFKFIGFVDCEAQAPRKAQVSENELFFDLRTLDYTNEYALQW